MTQGQNGSAGGAVWFWYTGTLCLMWVASFFPTERLWGLNWYGYFSWYGRLILLGVGATLPVLLTRWRSFGLADSEQTDTRPFRPIALILILTLTSAHALLSTRTHFLGDGYQLLSRLETGSVPIRPWNMGVYFLVENVYALVGGSGEPQAELAYRIISWVCGLLFLGTVALTAPRLYRSGRERLLFFLGAASGGYVLLFFGYVENYPPLVLLTGVVTFLGLLAIAGKVSKLWILLPCMAAILVHPFAAILVPGALFVLLQNSCVASWYRTLGTCARRLGWGLLASLALVAFIRTWQASLFLRLSLLPITAGELTVEEYTLFSLDHILDFLNLLFLLSPGVLFLVWILVASRRRQHIGSLQYRFLFLLLVPSLLLAFLFDPKLGMPRDWDLFAFSGVPLVVLLYHSLLESRNQVRGHTLAAALSIALSFMVLVPRAVTQMVPDISIAVFDSYSNLDVVRTASGRFVLLKYLEDNGRLAEMRVREEENFRLLQFQVRDIQGQNLFREGKTAQAEAIFRQATAAAPNYSYSWANIGTCFARREQWDSALTYFRIADGLNPFNSDTYNSLGFSYFKLGDPDKAHDYFTEAIRLSPMNFTARANLANLYAEQGQKESLVKLVSEAMELDSIPNDYFYLSADQLIELGEFDAAKSVCRRALERGVDSGMIRQLEAENPQFRFTPSGP